MNVIVTFKMLTRQCFVLPDSFNLLCAQRHREKGLKVKCAQLEHRKWESEISVVFCHYDFQVTLGRTKILWSVKQWPSLPLWPSLAGVKGVFYRSYFGFPVLLISLCSFRECASVCKSSWRTEVLFHHCNFWDGLIWFKNIQITFWQRLMADNIKMHYNLCQGLGGEHDAV